MKTQEGGLYKPAGLFGERKSQCVGFLKHFLTGVRLGKGRVGWKLRRSKEIGQEQERRGERQVGKEDESK